MTHRALAIEIEMDDDGACDAWPSKMPDLRVSARSMDAALRKLLLHMQMHLNEGGSTDDLVVERSD